MKENLFSLKLFTLLLVSLLSLNFVSAQINISQNFDSSTSFSTLGWSASSSYSNSSTNRCGTVGRTPRGLLSAAGTNLLTSPNQLNASNGLAIGVSFTYKVLNMTGGTPAPANFGSIEVQYSTNGFASFTTAYTINSSNYTGSATCTPINFTIPSGTIPNGSSFQIRFLGTWASGSFYIHLDDVIVSQSTGSVPNCNSNLTTPANGSTNVPISTSSINWSTATGSPTGYKLRVGTSPGASNIINNVDVGNVTTYPVTLNYSTTYYVAITPYNANGDATGCTEKTFSTAAPITTSRPWNEEFTSTTPPNGWTTSGFTIFTSTRLPESNGNIIFKNLNPSSVTGNFSTISVGTIQAGDQLNFDYRLGNNAIPYNPPAAGSGNFIISISTDYGFNYTNVQTINNSGVAGWQNYVLDLSSYVGEFVKIKITTNRISGDYFIGFDNFYIGQEITCEAPESLNLNYVGDNSAKISWNSIPNASGYNWYILNAGANPNSTPILSGTVNSPTVTISGLNASTDYDFYLEANCGVTDGLSQFSDVLSFSTQCQTIENFPFTETFEDDSTSRDCWMMEYVVGNTPWAINEGAAGGNITSAHTGTYNALFFFASYATYRTKLVSPSLNLSNMNSPKLSFWYANEQGPNPGEQNELSIYYKNELGGDWNLIPGAIYTSNINNWTYVELDLPFVTENYYIAFEGKNNYGEGIVLDDITISDLDTCPVTTWDGLSWSNGIPNLNKKAVINEDLVLNANLEACEIEVSPNGSLEIPAGFSLTVNGSITNNAAADKFVVASGANLIQISDIANTGNIKVIRESQDIVRLDYTMWSSPVSGQQLQAFSPQTLQNRIYTYETSPTTEATDGSYVSTTATSNFTNGKGYLFRAPDNWGTNPLPYQGKFYGVPFNGDLIVPVYPNGFTSVGNPYPSNIDPQTFMEANDANGMFFWNNPDRISNGNGTYSYVGTTYVSFTGAGFDDPSYEGNSILVGQGFLVHSNSNEVAFNNEMRTADAGTFFKNNTVERHRFWLSFKLKNPITGNPENYSQLNTNLLSYQTGATDGFDSGLDARIFGYAGSALYSIIEGRNEKYSTQARGLPFEITDVIPMGIRIITAGEFSINLTQTDGLFSEDQDIYLHDKSLNVIINLKSETYFFTSSAGDFTDRFEIIYVSPNEGCPSETIWDGMLWSNGTPDLNTKAIIDGELVVDTNLEACELEVTADGNLQIPSGFVFIVNGIITNNATPADFIIASGGNLIQNENVENIGAITVQRESQDILRLDYTMWASPVTGQQLQAFSPSTFANRIFTYETNIETETTEGAYVTVTDATANFANGKGYLFRAPNTWSSNTPAPYNGLFNGVPFNGEISVPVYNNGFTSVGNPYPSNIDPELFMDRNNVESMHFWNNPARISNGDGTYSYVGTSYVAYTNVGFDNPAYEGNSILLGQGFLVKSTSSKSVTFNNEMRTANEGVFFKNGNIERHRFWLNLSNQSDQTYNNILVGYMSGATNEMDSQIDGQQFGYEGSALYNLIGHEKFTIQGRALPFEKSDVVKLGFKAEQHGRFKISITNFDGMFAENQIVIYLKDKQTDTLHNLMESDYLFESPAGEFNERFEIVYETEEVMGSDELTSHSIQIYKNNDNIVVSSKSEKILTVELFDMVGRNIFRNEKVNSNHYEFKSQFKGVLIIRVQSQNGKIISKKIINK